jgi:zinc transport system substrate-binding protein
MIRVLSVTIAFNLIISVLSLLCLALPTASAGGPLSVYVVNYPLKYFAERIGGPHVKVTLQVPPDVDPVYWIPSIADISAYQQADLILLNGAGYAKWITKVSLPRSKTVDTSRSFKDRHITVKEIMTHSHGSEGEHAHEGLAFTTWLDLSLATRQAEAVYVAFSRKQPELKSKFKTNYQLLKNDLQLLDDRLKHIVSQNPATPLLFSHPVYDYFIKRYGFHAKSVHWEPDQKPTENQLSELLQILKNHRARWIVWEGEPIKAAVEELDEMNINSIVYNPCGNIPKDGDFLSVMQRNVSNFETVFR